MAKTYIEAIRALFSGRFHLGVSTTDYGITNNIGLNWRNAADSADVTVAKLDGSDHLMIGDSLTATRMVFSGQKTITDGSASSLFEVAVPNNAVVGGVVFATIDLEDGTNYQALTSMVTFSAVSKAGTLTSAITNATANDAKAVSSGTITTTWTNVTGTAKITIKVQTTGSLTETVSRCTFTVILNAPQAITLL